MWEICFRSQKLQDASQLLEQTLVEPLKENNSKTKGKKAKEKDLPKYRILYVGDLLQIGKAPGRQPAVRADSGGTTQREQLKNKGKKGKGERFAEVPNPLCGRSASDRKSSRTPASC